MSFVRFVKLLYQGILIFYVVDDKLNKEHSVRDYN